MDYTKLKSEIIDEIGDSLDEFKDLNLNECIDLFFDVLNLDLKIQNLSGVNNRILNGLDKIFFGSLSKIDKNAFFPEVSKIEPFLRKIVCIINKSAFDKITENNQGLSALINELDLNKNNINFNWENLSHNQKSNCSEHLLKVYKLRNIESHQCKNWSNSNLYSELKSVLVIYIFTVYLHKNELKKINKNDTIKDWIQNEVAILIKAKPLFVHTDVKEVFDNLLLNVYEVIENTEEEHDPRSGTVDNIFKNLSENQMFIIGEVGSGKSTTLSYLFLRDCELFLKNKVTKIPILIKLKNLSKDESIKHFINRKTKLDSKLIDYLKKGDFIIYLDGLNEIDKSIKSEIYIEIKQLINQYPKNKFLISSRPFFYNREFDNNELNIKIPIFKLQPLNDNQIVEFIDKNGKNVREEILLEIKNNNRLKEIIRTPLMLLMLISVVKRYGNIPENKARLIKTFIYSLYERELKQDFNFDNETLHLLLCYLGFETRSLTGSNSGLNKREFIIPLLEEKNKSLGININLLDFIKKSIDLNILVQDDENISFSHEIYQEYYAAEFLHQLN
jgi:predicted NACHT family NTPase